jgi:hypothetical protein
MYHYISNSCKDGVKQNQDELAQGSLVFEHSMSSAIVEVGKPLIATGKTHLTIVSLILQCSLLHTIHYPLMNLLLLLDSSSDTQVSRLCTCLLSALVRDGKLLSVI